ncbi:hypothetical protein BDZ89DRAFT_1073068 [Hymenopellis radicata]|nr:hypothetical protein BDZ89DRAFT_1073068 [Hymenopellis radicata]
MPPSAAADTQQPEQQGNAQPLLVDLEKQRQMASPSSRALIDAAIGEVAWKSFLNTCGQLLYNSLRGERTAFQLPKADVVLNVSGLKLPVHRVIINSVRENVVDKDIKEIRLYENVQLYKIFHKYLYTARRADVRDALLLIIQHVPDSRDKIMADFLHLVESSCARGGWQRRELMDIWLQVLRETARQGVHRGLAV